MHVRMAAMPVPIILGRRPQQFRVQLCIREFSAAAFFAFLSCNTCEHACHLTCRFARRLFVTRSGQSWHQLTERDVSSVLVLVIAVGRDFTLDDFTARARSPVTRCDKVENHTAASPEVALEVFVNVLSRLVDRCM